MKRIAIVGGPRTGKSTLAAKLSRDTGLPLIASDDYKDLDWSEASQHVADLLTKNEPAIVEGVAVPRALRKMLAARPEERPIDKLIVLEAPKVPRSNGQKAMSKGVHTVLDEILPELRALGVEIEWRTDPHTPGES